MNLKNKWGAAVVCVSLIALSLSGFSQKRGQELVDSLQKEITRQADDTNKVLTLMRLSGAWAVTDHSKGFAPVNEALQLSEKLHWKRGIANAENNLGLYMSDTGNTVGARQHFEISYKLNVERGSRINVVNNLVNIGRTYSYESDFPRAVDYFFRGLKVAEEIQDEQKMSLAANNLASNFLKQHNAQKGLEYGLYTVDHAAKARDSSSMIKGLNFIGDAYAELKDTAAALRWMDSSVTIAKKAGLLVDLTDAMGDRAQFISDLQKRVSYELETEKLMKEITPNSTGHLSMMAKLGSDYLTLAKQAGPSEKAGLLKKAGDYLQGAQVLVMERNNPARLAEVLAVKVELEEYEGRYKEALADHKMMTTLNDSLFSQDSKNKIAGQEADHTVALKDAELQLSQLNLSSQRKTTIGLVAGVGLLTIFGILLYRQSSSRKKTNAALQVANAELEEANKVKARFFGILSHDLRGPVASLLHFLDIQKEAPDLMNESQQVSNRRQITDSAENLLNTMEGMLLWSKQQMKSFRPSLKNISVDAQFDYLKKFFGELENIDLVFSAEGGLIVFTDENYLRTIMQNLSSNAIKALKDRPGATIEWKAWKENLNTIFSITDNGPGLKPEQAKALYEEGIADNAREGFGLHMTRDLAKAIHCRIDVQAEPGKGTTFILTLPHTQDKTLS